MIDILVESILYTLEIYVTATYVFIPFLNWMYKEIKK